MSDLSGIRKKAEEVLQKNLYEVTLNGKLYRRTVPTKEFYVHQWNWDSATHAMGLIHIDEGRAYDELLALVSGQWSNGLIAQITFNPQETKYFPGPQFWGTEKFANGEIITSGITQPPLLAISANYVYQNSKNTAKAESFLKKILPALIKYHDYLKQFRDPEDSGLLTVIHPWEAGTDNTPRFDLPLADIPLDTIPDEVKILVNQYRSDDKLGDAKHRPGMDDYYRYMYLVHLFKSWDWDYTKIVQQSPFAVKDILFNALWSKANESLAKLLTSGGKTELVEKYANWSDQTQKALKNLWNEDAQIYTDLDVALGKHQVITENTVATFIPLWANVPDEKQVELLLKKLVDPKQFWSEYPVPTTALNSPKFELTRYWRGPTWPITNLFVIEGLANFTFIDQAEKILGELTAKTLKMIAENGFFEYFDPTKGSARPGKAVDVSLGFGSFSWTAAIYIYLSNKLDQLKL
ncbi:MAG TPA: trehalase family glycosidase [Candidatus Dojkabacteria bacterium]|nr:trehalase family glycosidase [Candidatus Dojkabacteria bacterium]